MSKSVSQIISDLESGATTSVALVHDCAARIDRLNPDLNAVLSVQRDDALKAAEASDARRKSGKPLSAADGVPILLKDNICATGGPTTCASRVLENYRPPYDATATAKLRAAGVVVLGKTNMDEFAMGSTTEWSAFGMSKNPWKTDHVPGGSSGGSAVAVASGMAPWALGSDTGGSIRQPAGFCGVVGMKPTYGRVSRYGLVAFASSLDQIGPFASNVEDAALLMNLIAGHDGRDSTSADVPPEDCVAELRNGRLAGLRIGRPRQFFDVEGIDDDVRSVTDGTLDILRREGAEIVDVNMPFAEEYSVAAYYVIAAAEASSNLARYDGAHYGYRAKDSANIVEMFSRSRAEGFGAEVKRRVMLGTFALSAETFDAYYVRAQKARTLIKRDYDNALKECDAILAPVAPTPAFPAGEKTGDPVRMYLADVFTLSLNLAGYCGLSLPAGFSKSGLPIGVQLLAGAFGEKGLLQTAWQLESKLGIAGSRTPAVFAR